MILILMPTWPTPVHPRQRAGGSSECDGRHAHRHRADWHVESVSPLAVSEHQIAPMAHCSNSRTLLTFVVKDARAHQPYLVQAGPRGTYSLPKLDKPSRTMPAAVVAEARSAALRVLDRSAPPQ